MMNPYQSPPLPEAYKDSDDLPTVDNRRLSPAGQNQVMIKLVILLMFAVALAIGIMPFTWFMWAIL